ncbi:MAG: hypothetical protein ABI859_16865 [Pseudomonadota bacterium]
MSLTWRTTSPCSEITEDGRYAVSLYRRESMPGRDVLFSTRAYLCPPAGTASGTAPTLLGVESSADRELVLRAARQHCEDHAARAASTDQPTGA